MKNNIEWVQAVEVSETYQNEIKDNSEAKIQEFLESDCELMDSADLQYYADETGKSIDWLLAHGKNINPRLSMLLRSGLSLDETSLIDNMCFSY